MRFFGTRPTPIYSLRTMILSIIVMILLVIMKMIMIIDAFMASPEAFGRPRLTKECVEMV